MSTLWIIPDENGVSVFFLPQVKNIFGLCISKGLVDFR